MDLSPTNELFEALAGGASAAEWLWQLGVGATALVLGWYAAHVICREVKPSAKWKFGAGDFENVAYPLCAYGFVVIGRLILENYQSAAALAILQTLLAAWAVIRLAMYVLGHVLPEGGFLRASIRTIAWIAGIAFVLHITGLLPQAIAGLDGVGFSVGKDKSRITLWLVLQALAALATALALAAWISRITETRVMAAKHVEMSTRVVIAKVVRVSALFLAVMVALPLVGIDITALSIFSGALGVGLGFGLQKIASNYVSGFIVLLDRSLRIGDTIMVDNRRGEVTAIESRYTVIRGSDGIESIIPNEKLITESVSHYSFTDARVSMVVPVSVAYEADLARALDVLLECARRHPKVLGEPPMAARIKRLGEFGVDLELVAWIGDSAAEGAIRSEMLLDFVSSFRQAGLELSRRDARALAATAATENIPSEPTT